MCYLLLNGELPTIDELEGFKQSVTAKQMVNEKMKKFFDGVKFSLVSVLLRLVCVISVVCM